VTRILERKILSGIGVDFSCRGRASADVGLPFFIRGAVGFALGANRAPLRICRALWARVPRQMTGCLGCCLGSPFMPSDVLRHNHQFGRGCIPIFYIQELAMVLNGWAFSPPIALLLWFGRIGAGCASIVLMECPRPAEAFAIYGVNFIFLLLWPWIFPRKLESLGADSAVAPACIFSTCFCLCALADCWVSTNSSIMPGDG